MPVTRRRFVTGCAACAAMMRAAAAPPDSSPTWQSIKGPGFTLNYVGQMREVIMSGNRAGKLDLRDLHRSGHPYGLGPVAELQGEVILMDGQITVSVVDEQGKVRVSEVPNVSVPFFVWADVTAWHATAPLGAAPDLGALARQIGEAGASARLGDAFPFLISGKFKRLAYHIVHGRPGAPPGMEEHRNMQVPFAIENAEATLVGFWSSRHHGIFTHANSNVHVHFVAGDRSTAGHLEDASADAGRLVLQLPAET
jgi:acetolactate decarboxylase